MTQREWPEGQALEVRSAAPGAWPEGQDLVAEGSFAGAYGLAGAAMTKSPGTRVSGLLAGWDQLFAGRTGLEPATSGVTGRRYNRLNYHPDLFALRREGP